MKFITLTPDLAQVWDDIVFASDDAWVYHLYNWLQMTEKVWGLDSKSFLVEHECAIIAIFPLQLHGNTKTIKSVFMGSAGAAILNNIDAAFRERIMKAMYAHAEEIARENGSLRIDVYLPSLAKSSLNNLRGVNPLVYYFYSDISTHTWVVDLAQPENVIFANLSDDARRSIKQATAAGYQIKKLESREEIGEYYEAHYETYHRTGATPFPKEYFLGIYKNICEKGYGAIWKAVTSDGKPAAFEIIGLFKKGAIYWSGCCKTAHLDSGVNYLLQYHSILWAKGQGAEWFENGEAFPNIREGKLLGLTTFKRKFGGKLHRFYKGRLMLGTGSKREKFIDLLLGLLRKIYHFFTKVYRFTKMRHRIGFLKPYWDIEEFFTIFFTAIEKMRRP